MQETEVKEKKRRTQETEIVFSRLDSCCCKLCTQILMWNKEKALS